LACLFLTTELGGGRRWACNCGEHNFPQIWIRDNSNVKHKGGTGRGSSCQRRTSPGVCTPFPRGHLAMLSHSQRREETCTEHPSQHLLSGVCFRAQLVLLTSHPVDRWRLALGKHLAPSQAVTHISSTCPIK